MSRHEQRRAAPTRVDLRIDELVLHGVAIYRALTPALREPKGGGS